MTQSGGQAGRDGRRCCGAMKFWLQVVLAFVAGMVIGNTLLHVFKEFLFNAQARNSGALPHR
jgi:hypothetical protein